MPVWLQIVVAIVGLIGSSAGILGISAYINERMKHKASKIHKKEDEEESQHLKDLADLEEIRYERYKQGLREIISEENKPIIESISTLKNDIALIKSNLGLDTEGTITILRNEMKRSLDFCKERGFAKDSDKANWIELYNTYAKLGGNHFKEYIDVWKCEMERLPLKIKKNQKKQN